MPELRRLSDTSADAGKNAAKYIRLFRAAVAEEEIQAFELAEKFKLPAASRGAKAREVPDFAILAGSVFDAWHAEAVVKSQSNTRGNAPTFAEATEAASTGSIDIEELARRTSERLKATRLRSEKANAKKRKNI